MMQCSHKIMLYGKTEKNIDAHRDVEGVFCNIPRG